MFSIIHSHITDVAPLYPKRKRLGKRGFPYHIQQHATCSMRITRSVPDIAADRRVAVPQVVGVVQKALQRQQQGIVDQEQRIDYDFTASEYVTIHFLRILRYLSDTDSCVNLCQQLCNLLHHQSAGYAICILVQKNTST